MYFEVKASVEKIGNKIHYDSCGIKGCKKKVEEKDGGKYYC